MLRNRLAALASWSTAVLITGIFIWILSDIIRQGAANLSFDFLTELPQNAGRKGGIASILASTGLILSVCLAVSLPLGIGTAVLLSEFTHHNSPFGLLVRRSLDVLAGVPSIVFGLFGNVLFCKILGLGFSILSGGLTLACMVLPLFIRLSEEGFCAVPDEYRSGAAALGLSKTSTVLHIILPAAAPSLLVGLILGVGRALAETAALIFTSGYVDRMPSSLLDSGRALSIHIFDLSMNVPGGNANAYATALVLIILLLLINQAAAYITQRWLHERVQVA